jgi:hypothetical protein
MQARVLPFPRRQAVPQLGFDFQSLLTGSANIASQINSLISGSPTSAIYQPTTIPLNTGTNLQNYLPYLAIAGVFLYLWSGRRR